MIRKYLLPILALLGVILAIRTVISGQKPVPVAQPVALPAVAPFAAKISGAGIVEASTENIAIGTPVAGVVTKIFVQIGDHLKAGDPLFKLDDRTLTADLAIKKAALLAAQSKLQRLLNLPRPEDIPPAEAQVGAAESALADVQSDLAMWKSVPDRRAVTQETLDRKQFAVRLAEAKLAEAKANLALLKAGSWKPDIEVARADVASAQAAVQSTQTELDRITIRAPVDGQIMQIKIRLGEFAPAEVLQTPLMLMGGVDRLHVRVDIDEDDAWRFDSNRPAMGFLRGNRERNTPLVFVRAEPYVIPKKSLTGDSTERVDTRVLQVIYSFDPKVLRAYVGQQMDVEIEAAPIAEATTRKAQ